MIYASTLAMNSMGNHDWPSNYYCHEDDAPSVGINCINNQGYYYDSSMAKAKKRRTSLGISIFEVISQ